MVEGRFTSKLKTLKTGTIVGLEQPIGHFVYEGQKNAAFIAGGTGLAPFVSMLRYIADKKLEGKFVLFYSAKTSDSIVYKDEFARLEQKNPNIKVVVTLTQECKGWCGEQGRINNEMIQKYILDPKEFAWWMCGPLEMVKCMRENLIIIGANPKNINMEGWG
jgi:ferredoxin-NADP reductase